MLQNKEHRTRVLNQEYTIAGLRNELRSMNESNSKVRSPSYPEIAQVYQTFQRIFGVMAETQAEIEGSKVREVAKHQRLMGILMDVNSRLNATENSVFKMTTMLHALMDGDPEVPLPALAPVAPEEHWGIIIPEGEQLMVYQAPPVLQVPQYPDSTYYI
eukprot:4843045-Amphidinium_carterae.2